MKLAFLGAAHEVTGSCYLLTVGEKKLLVDFGMRQGIDQYKNTGDEIPVAAGDIDYVLLTHAHIDHSGRLPLLFKNGYKGEIFATDPTCDLCGIMLRDSAHIQEFEAEWRNRKAKRSGKEYFEPLYTMEDAESAVAALHHCAYSKKIKIDDGITIRFIDVGHLLGSASIEIWLEEEGISRKIVFSGDIGNTGLPLIKDPEYIKEADYVVMESTYGDRLHDTPPDYAVELADIIQRTFDRGGNLVIPSFAVGRTQELLYYIRDIKSRGLVKNHAEFPVYIDSPLANAATTIFAENIYESYDDEARALVNQGINPIGFPGLRISETSDDSKAINFDETSKVIISASGMCEAGRIKHHLKHNLWRPESTVLFVGYQAVGTLGRRISDGAEKVKIFGEEIEVRSEITKLEGLSGHADQNGLIKWIESFETHPKQVFVTHGEESVCEFFAGYLREKLGYSVLAPFYESEFDLADGHMLTPGLKLERKERIESGQQAGSAAYQRLVETGKRLQRIIEKSSGWANKELGKFADQIIALCQKWED